MSRESNESVNDTAEAGYASMMTSVSSLLQFSRVWDMLPNVFAGTHSSVSSTQIQVNDRLFKDQCIKIEAYTQQMNEAHTFEQWHDAAVHLDALERNGTSCHHHHPHRDLCRHHHPHRHR